MPMFWLNDRRCCSLSTPTNISMLLLLLPVLLALLLLPSQSQSALILPMNYVVESQQQQEGEDGGGFVLPDAIRQELSLMDEQRSSKKRSSSEEVQPKELASSRAEPQIPLLSILSGLSPPSQNHQCFCCRAFVCRRQPCPCSKFFL